MDTVPKYSQNRPGGLSHTRLESLMHKDSSGILDIRKENETPIMLHPSKRFKNLYATPLPLDDAKKRPLKCSH